MVALIFWPVYNKFCLIIYSKIGNDLYLQWAYGHYETAKNSIWLMIIVGLPQIAALFIFESNWKMYTAYGTVTVLHWASLVFGYIGLRRQRKINSHVGLLGGVLSTIF